MFGHRAEVIGTHNPSVSPEMPEPVESPRLVPGIKIWTITEGVVLISGLTIANLDEAFKMKRGCITGINYEGLHALVNLDHIVDAEQFDGDTENDSDY